MNADHDADLNLLLARADDHAAVLAEGLPDDTAGDQTIERADLGGISFYDLGAAGNELDAQGWGVVAPIGPRGDELLARIKPLIDARAAMMDTPPRIYRVPATMTTEQALRWRQDVYNNDEPDLIPRYQLFLGDLHELPLELQQVQAPEGFVGRLAFTDLEGYEAYVDKLLRWERGPSAAPRGDACFFSVQDGSAATTIGHRALMQPTIDKALAMQAEGRFQAGKIHALGDPLRPSQDELLRAAAGLEAGVLFTMSHGEGAPAEGWSSARAQLEGQGAMSFGGAGNLPARELVGKTFAAGGVWFMFACFGAGTPLRSRFHPWLAQLAASGRYRGKPDAVLASVPRGDQRPFIAALPQAALASPGGPLAFVGHLDLAWTYSFMDIADGRQKGRPEKYYNILKSLVRGDRVGVALQELERFYNDKNQELTDLQDLAEDAALQGRPVDANQRVRMSHLWMVRQDLAGYILLGDPAVQLPLTRPGKPTRPRAEAIEIRTATIVPAPESSHSESSHSQSPPAPATPASNPAAFTDDAREGPATAAQPAASTSEPGASAPGAPDPAPRAPTMRSGEAEGELEIAGPTDLKLRFRLRWKFD